MKLNTKLSILAATCGFSATLQAAPVLVTNGDFETAGGVSWGEAGGPDTTFSYPEDNGNPGGYGVMTNNGNENTFGVFIANSDSLIPLGDLGLTAGKSYVFSQDMALLSGSDFGKLKIEFYENGNPESISNTGDMPKPLPAGSTWATYTYQVSIPSNADTLKVVPVAGIGSSVGYDNIGVDNTPIIIPPGPRIPNGDFETPGGASWAYVGDAEPVVSYPSDEGNLGGFAEINASAGGSGSIATNNNAPLSLASLGLTAGETYTFTVDMRLISGSNIGGFKVEFIPTGTGPLSTSLIGDGTTWETYSFDVTIPETSTQIIMFLLSGADSSVAYDNFDIIVPEPEPFYAGIRKGIVVNWELEGDGLIYQAQGSFDQEEWDNIGPLIEDDTITSAFDQVGYPFYRVEVTQNVLSNVAPNGDFEENFNNPICADSWVCFSNSGQEPVWTTEDAQSGDACMRIAVQNDETPTPNKSELQQNIFEAGGTITAGETYEFSFWAKQLSIGVSYVQKFRLQWLDSEGNILFDPPFADFTAGIGTWKKTSLSGLVAPEGATTAFIQIFGDTGAVPSLDAKGGVLIDNLNLATAGREPFDDIFATTTEGVEISWLTEAGKTYQIESSPDLKTFTDFGAPRTGSGGTDTAADPVGPVRKYYRVIKTP